MFPSFFFIFFLSSLFLALMSLIQERKPQSLGIKKFRSSLLCRLRLSLFAIREGEGEKKVHTICSLIHFYVRVKIKLNFEVIWKSFLYIKKHVLLLLLNHFYYNFCTCVCVRITNTQIKLNLHWCESQFKSISFGGSLLKRIEFGSTSPHSLWIEWHFSFQPTK